MTGRYVVFDASALGPALAALCDALDREMAGCVHRAAEAVAHYAARVHGYTRRTGTLAANTVAVPTSGTFLADTLQTAAVGNTPYASYVERDRRFAFLEPAWEAVEGRADQDLDDSLTRAARDAGW